MLKKIWYGVNSDTFGIYRVIVLFALSLYVYFDKTMSKNEKDFINITL